MLFKGFQLGMLLQIAMGPVCLFIFQTASASGFAAAEAGAAVLVLFGLNLVIGTFWTDFLPSFSLSEKTGAGSASVRAS